MSVVACPFCGAKDALHESPSTPAGLLDALGRTFPKRQGFYRCHACWTEFAVQERALDGAWVRLPR